VFYVLVFTAMVATAVLVPLRFSLPHVAAAVALALAWMLLEHAAPTLLRMDRLTGGAWGAVAVVVLVVTFGLAFSQRVFLPLVPLLALGTVRFDRHTKWALLLGLLVLVAVLAWEPLSRRLRHRAIPA
jgi:hypothetical protein